MSRKRCDVPARLSKFCLVIGCCKVEFAKQGRTTESFNKVIQRRCDVLFSFDCFICTSHVDTNSQAFLWLRNDNNGGNTRRGASRISNDIKGF